MPMSLESISICDLGEVHLIFTALTRTAFRQVRSCRDRGPIALARQPINFTLGEL